MGLIMKQFKFNLFSKRIGNIEIRNFYKTDKINQLQSHLGKKNYETFEVIKWSENPYFGKESEYIKDGDNYRLPESECCHIDKSCFEYSESALVLAFFDNVYNDDSICVMSCGDRLFTLDKHEKLAADECIRDGFLFINNEINKALTDKKTSICIANTICFIKH